MSWKVTGFGLAASVVDDEATAYRFGWDYAQMAVEPMFLDWRTRDWPPSARHLALAGYVDRRRGYGLIDGGDFDADLGDLAPEDRR
jgi:hypothetical protein